MITIPDQFQQPDKHDFLLVSLIRVKFNKIVTHRAAKNPNVWYAPECIGITPFVKRLCGFYAAPIPDIFCVLMVSPNIAG